MTDAGKQPPTDAKGGGNSGAADEDADAVVERVAFRLVEARTGKHEPSRLKLLAFFLLVLSVLGGLFFWWQHF